MKYYSLRIQMNLDFQIHSSWIHFLNNKLHMKLISFLSWKYCKPMKSFARSIITRLYSCNMHNSVRQNKMLCIPMKTY